MLGDSIWSNIDREFGILFWYIYGFVVLFLEFLILDFCGGNGKK